MSANGMTMRPAGCRGTSPTHGTTPRGRGVAGGRLERHRPTRRAAATATPKRVEVSAELTAQRPKTRHPRARIREWAIESSIT